VYPAVAVKLVIDHIAGSRRGQRQELDADRRVRFGRHPDCDVAFDAHRDIDASSRHAELRRQGDGWVVVDVGSSNGTFVDGKRITEIAVEPGAPVTIEFGPDGPKLRLFIGDDEQVVQLPVIEAEPPRRRGRVVVLVVALIAVVAAVGVALLVR
jgi:pSer/pThr/pTyr-binding forkhead associated (FHA) protein